MVQWKWAEHILCWVIELYFFNPCFIHFFNIISEFHKFLIFLHTTQSQSVTSIRTMCITWNGFKQSFFKISHHKQNCTKSKKQKRESTRTKRQQKLSENCKINPWPDWLCLYLGYIVISKKCQYIYKDERIK